MISKTLKIVTWNANGVSRKHVEISNFLFKNKIDILAINETRLKARDKFFINGYKTFRTDRKDNTGYGGIAILTKNNIKSVN